MVTPVHGNSPRRRVLHAADADNGEAVFQPFRADQAAMRQQAMIAEIDPQSAEQIGADKGQKHARPAEIPRQDSKQCQRMIDDDGDRIGPDDTTQINRGGQGEPAERQRAGSGG